MNKVQLKSLAEITLNYAYAFSNVLEDNSIELYVRDINRFILAFLLKHLFNLFG